MAAPQNHWKLGLFVVAGMVMALSAVVLLGVRSMQRDVVLYVSYFDESVQGLEVGSPIKFRGVSVGTVGKIQVAPDHRHVEVESELGVEELARLGLDIARKPSRFGAPIELVMAPDLRIQLASSGLTGIKFLQLDFFDVSTSPPPVLSFDVPENYIPATPSLLKNLNDSVNRVMISLPEITDQASAILSDVESIIVDAREQQFPDQISAVLDTANNLLATAQQKVWELDLEGISGEAMQILQTAEDLIATVQEKIESVDTAGISEGALWALDAADALLVTALDKLDQLNTAALSRNANRTLTGVTAAVARLDGLFLAVGRDGGLLSSVERAAGAVGDTLRDADGLGGQLVRTLVSVEALARSIRKLTEALEEDPDMLLKGRAQEKPR